MYNLIKYSDNYSKRSGSFWHYYRDESRLANVSINDFPAHNNKIILLKFKTKIACRTGTDSTKILKIIVLLKCLSNFSRTVQMPLTNCEINLIVTWSDGCFIIDNLISSHEPTFSITDTKL